MPPPFAVARLSVIATELSVTVIDARYAPPPASAVPPANVQVSQLNVPPIAYRFPPSLLAELASNAKSDAVTLAP